MTAANSNIEPIIQVRNISKEYTIGIDSTYKTFGETFTNALRSPLKTLKSIRSQQETFWALKNINFEVEHGEVVGIIGRNGAGKTTLLKILSRITAPTEGEICLHGRVGSLLEVGTGFHPELTGRENIYFNGAILGMRKKEIDEKFDEIVNFSGVEKFLDTPVKRYSSGMQVRLAFSVAANLDPEILVVDEVLAVGDAEFQKKCLGKMKDVSRGGRTVLFVSHNLTAIKALCSRAILLENGNITIDDESDKVVNKYLNDFQNGVFQKTWKELAPQNDSVIITEVKISDNFGRLLDIIHTDDEFNVEISYKVKREGAYVGLTVIFYDNENNIIGSSINNLENRFYGRPLKIGLYKSKCHIPSNFFNNGWFKIGIILFNKNFSSAQSFNDVLNFEIIDGSAIRGDYFGGYGGYVRPLFKWSTNIITDDTNKE